MECFVRCSQLLHNFSVQTLNWKAVGEAAADDLCGDNRNGGASSGPFLISLTPIIRFSSCAYTHIGANFPITNLTRLQRDRPENCV